MTKSWIRLYVDVLNNPKVQRLSGDLFKGWINILLIAGINDGRLPPVGELAYRLRVSEKKAADLVSRLRAARLIDEVGDEGHLEPHDWGERQYESDSSTPRVSRFRKRKRAAACNGDGNVTRNGHVAPPDSDTDSLSERDGQYGDFAKLKSAYGAHNGMNLGGALKIFEAMPVADQEIAIRRATAAKAARSTAGRKHPKDLANWLADRDFKLIDDPEEAGKEDGRGRVPVRCGTPEWDALEANGRHLPTTYGPPFGAGGGWWVSEETLASAMARAADRKAAPP
jgi:hypothetical protein